MSDARAISEMPGVAGDRGATATGRASARDFMLLDHILGVLAGPLALEALRQVVHLLVPAMADLAALDIVAEDGTPERVAVAHATDPALAMLLQETASDLRDGIAATTLLVLRSGAPQLREVCDPARFERFLASADLTDIQQARLHELEPRSYLAVPLLARGRCLGVLTLLHTGLSGRRYDGSDLAWAQHLAGRIAAALEIAHLEREAQAARQCQAQLGLELERARALEQAAIETASGPIVVLDALGRMQRVNPLASRLLGDAPDELMGRPFWGAVPPAELAAVRASLDALLADGSPRTDTCHWLGRAGQRRLVRWTFTPLLGWDASVAYVLAVGDIAEDVARQAAASAGAERLRQVHALVATLARADTLEQVAKAVLDHACAGLGACAGTLMLCSSDGVRLEAVGAVGYPAGTAETALPVGMPVPVATAVRLGEAVVLASAEESLRAGYAQRPDHLQLGHGAWAAVPLQMRGRTLGALELSFPGPRLFCEDDRAFLLLLAAEGAQAIERVQLVGSMARPAPAELGIALSARERDVLERVVDGMTNREIADQLGLGVDTVKTHVDHICEKLAVAGTSRSRVLAVARAIQLGLVPADGVRQPPAVLARHRATPALGLHGATHPA